MIYLDANVVIRLVEGDAATRAPLVEQMVSVHFFPFTTHKGINKPASYSPLSWYDAGKEAAMIELTEQQVQALESAGAAPPRVVNPRTRETFVLLPLKEYERLKEEEYDDSPWTREELQALAWEVAERNDWEEHDEVREKP